MTVRVLRTPRDLLVRSRGGFVVLRSARDGGAGGAVVVCGSAFHTQTGGNIKNWFVARYLGN